MKVGGINRADRIYRGWVAVEICGLTAVLILFNAFPQWVGILASAENPASFVPLLTPEFHVYMPLLNFWWALALCLAYLELFYGRWTLALRAADLGLCVLGIRVLGRFLFGGPIVGLNYPAIPLLDQAVKLFLGLALAGSIVALVRKLVQLMARALAGEWEEGTAMSPGHTSDNIPGL
jgi:hypothetical protein